MAGGADAVSDQRRAGVAGDEQAAAGGRHGAWQDGTDGCGGADSAGAGRDSVVPCDRARPSVLDQWRQELTRWAPELSAIIVRGPADDRSWQWQAQTDVKLVSYGVLRQDADRLATMRPARHMWDVVVADEAQRIKNLNDTSEAVKSLRRVRSWALTGTPIENKEEELASIMEFVDHDGTSPLKRYFPGSELLYRHKEVQLRRKKNEVLDDLPPKQETKLSVALGPRQRASYAKAEEEGIVYLKSLGAEVRVRHVLELITRLKQICNFDPRDRRIQQARRHQGATGPANRTGT